MRSIFVNTQERAVSTDINRLQKFARRDLEEIARFQILGLLGGIFAPEAESYPSSAAAPAVAEVIGGLLVRPQSGTFDLLVDPGTLAVLAPDGAADTSSCRIAVDAGVPLSGTLSIGANSSGSTRIDVIECSLDPTPDVATDNRDVFNELTGLFTATAVTKEIGDRLRYRVRAGTPGSGYPAAQSGWLPLCVASVPTGAANNDDVTFWDVRPMLDDRAAGERRTATFGEVLDVSAYVTRVSNVSATLQGNFSGTNRGRKFGGKFRRTTPGTYSATAIDIAELANQDSAIAEALTGTVYVYSCTPFGLPRWAMYAPAPSARLPASPCGLLVASYVRPSETATPYASTTIALPASTGLGGTAAATESVCVAAVPRVGGTNNWMDLGIQGRSARLRAPGPSLASAAFASSAYSFSVDGTFWPPNARVLYARFSASVPIADGAAYSGLSQVAVNSSFGGDLLSVFAANHSGAGKTLTLYAEHRIHRPAFASGTLTVKWFPGVEAAFYGASPTLTTASMNVVGYEI